MDDFLDILKERFVFQISNKLTEHEILNYYL